VHQILAARQRIYDEFQRSAGPRFFFKAGNNDRFAAYYTSMFLIADTGESLMAHRQEDFSSDPYASYLEFWGVMQAIIIQQDSIRELHKAIIATSLVIPRPSAWWQLRELRIQSAGHPANRSRGVRAPQRTFMGRMPRSYSHVQYELWDAHTGKTTHPTVDLGQILDNYDLQASGFLAGILQSMRAQWP